MDICKKADVCMNRKHALSETNWFFPMKLFATTRNIFGMEWNITLATKASSNYISPRTKSIKTVSGRK